MTLLTLFKRGLALMTKEEAEKHATKDAEARAEARAEATKKHDETRTAERIFELRRDAYTEELRLLLKLGYSVPEASKEAARRTL